MGDAIAARFAGITDASEGLGAVLGGAIAVAMTNGSGWTTGDILGIKPINHGFFELEGPRNKNILFLGVPTVGVY